MKRAYLLVVAMILLTAVLLTACTETKQTAIEILQSKCNEINSASKIEQKIEIKRGSLTNYLREVNYTKGDGYTAIGTEKTRNATDAEELYTTEQINEHYESTGSFVPGITLKVEYFAEGYNMTETSLVATIKGSDVTKVFTGNDLPTTDITLRLTVTDNHLSDLTISYTDSGNNVTISLKFTY